MCVRNMWLFHYLCQFFVCNHIIFTQVRNGDVMNQKFENISYTETKTEELWLNCAKNVVNTQDLWTHFLILLKCGNFMNFWNIALQTFKVTKVNYWCKLR